MLRATLTEALQLNIEEHGQRCGKGDNASIDYGDGLPPRCTGARGSRQTSTTLHRECT